MHHYIKTYKTYYQRRKSAKDCPFCKNVRFEKAIYEDDLFYIVHNATKYDLFEGLNVLEHLMVIPKRHITSFKEMTAKEKQVFMDLVADYEAGDYNLYVRGDSNVNRSVRHHHAHLIKTDKNKSKLLFYLHKPYLLIRF